MLVNLFSGVLQPECHRPNISGPFPVEPHFESHVPETILERVYLPLLEYIYEKFLPIRRLQHGHLHLYILNTLITLVALVVISLK